MKATDLQIGNYVTQDGEFIKGISSLTLHKYHLGQINLEPIELNEEWLIMLNIEQEFDRFYFQGSGNEYSIRISKTGGRLYLGANNAIYVYGVHEFQNWHKLLTGK